MRIPTMAGLGIAAVAVAGGVALGTAAFAADHRGAAPTIRIDQGASQTYDPEDCPERGGSGGPGPAQSGPGPSAPEQSAPERSAPEQSAPEQSAPEQSAPDTL